MLAENCVHSDGGGPPGRRKDTVAAWDIMGLILQSPLAKKRVWVPKGVRSYKGKKASGCVCKRLYFSKELSRWC